MYKLDTKLAIDGSSMTGGIDTSGAYVGAIVDAKPFASDNSQAAGVEFSFERSDGAKANYIKVYETKADGTPAKSAPMIHALMCCMKKRAINQHSDFCQPVGLVLQKENYIKHDQTEGYKFSIICPFEAESKKTAQEMIENKPATTVDKIVSTLVDKESKPAGTVRQKLPEQYHKMMAAGDSTNAGFDAPDFDDDIPF